VKERYFAYLVIATFPIVKAIFESFVNKAFHDCAESSASFKT